MPDDQTIPRFSDLGDKAVIPPAVMSVLAQWIAKAWYPDKVRQQG